MAIRYDFWAQAGRSFFLLFGAIWLAVGGTFAVIGIVMVLKVYGPLASSGTAGDAAALGPIFSAVGLLIGGAGGFLVARDVTRIRYRAALSQSGLPTQGMVTSVEPTSVSINKTRQWRVRYRYHDDRGQPHDGDTGPIAPSLAHSWQPEQPGEVRFDRERPERSIWLG